MADHEGVRVFIIDTRAVSERRCILSQIRQISSLAASDEQYTTSSLDAMKLGKRAVLAPSLTESSLVYVMVSVR
jgi:hypothetical protein